MTMKVKKIVEKSEFWDEEEEAAKSEKAKNYYQNIFISKSMYLERNRVKECQ